jgi:hypothetical protein
MPYVLYELGDFIYQLYIVCWSESTKDYMQKVPKLPPPLESANKALFGLHMLKFNSHHINVLSNA